VVACDDSTASVRAVSAAVVCVRKRLIVANLKFRFGQRPRRLMRGQLSWKGMVIGLYAALYFCTKVAAH